MKKALLFICMLFMGEMSMLALERIHFDVQTNYQDTYPSGSGQTRTPPETPIVEIDAQTLYFTTPCDGCILRLVNEDGEVEYATVIPVECTTLILPSDLEGEYELQIIQGNLCFYSMIEL